MSLMLFMFGDDHEMVVVALLFDRGEYMRECVREGVWRRGRSRW